MSDAVFALAVAARRYLERSPCCLKRDSLNPRITAGKLWLASYSVSMSWLRALPYSCQDAS